MADEAPQRIEPPEWISKTLATLDAISGYTFGSLAVAGAIVIWSPPGLFGVDLGPLRATWGGYILVGTIAFACLAVAKVLRTIHASIDRRRRERTARDQAEARARQEREAEEAARQRSAEVIRRRCASLSQGERSLVAFCLLENRQSIVLPMANAFAVQLVHKELLAEGGGRPTGRVFTFPDDVWAHVTAQRDDFLPPDRTEQWTRGLVQWAHDQQDWLSA